MPDRILIIDDVATHRILLKVKLAGAAYRIDTADTLAEARSLLAARRHVLVILAERVAPPAEIGAFCAELAGSRELPSVLVVGASGEGEGEAPLRLRALTNGAQDYLALPVDEGTLLARVRALVRQGLMTQGDYGVPWQPAPPGGLAEEGSPAPLAPGAIALVSPDPVEAMGWRRQLTGRTAHPLMVLRPADLFAALREGRRVEAILISARNGDLADLRLLADLKARAETALIPVIVLGAPPGEFGIMALDLGAQDVLPLPVDPEELALRLRLRLAQKHEHEARNHELAEQLRLANLDPLTGLANRRAALSRLSRLQADLSRGGAPYALMLLDIDRFKQVNDNWGHAAGDAVLVDVAGRAGAVLRSEDLLGRIGGEEFLVALPGTPLPEACLVAERLRRSIEAQPFRLPETSGARGAIRVTLSIGLCRPEPEESVESILERADRALYSAKALGRNMIEVDRSAA